MASSSGFTALLLIGLIALGASGDPGCEAPTDTVPADESDPGDDFSFDPGAGAPSGAEDDDQSDPADDDFSFDPETSQGAPSGAEDGDQSGEGDDFSFDPETD